MTEVVCVFPFWSQSDALNWDSNYAYLRRLLPRMSAERPDWLWVVMWPLQQYGADKWRWQDDGLFGDRIVRFGWPYDTAMRSSVMGWSPEHFKKLEESYAPTIYWMNQVESASQVMGGYLQSFGIAARPAVVGQHHYIIHKSLPYPVDGLLPRLWAQLAGTATADHVVFNSEHCRRMAWESFGEYLNQDFMGTLEAKSEVLLMGLIDSDLFDVPRRSCDVPVVLYNHRFETYKRADDTRDALVEMRGRGLPFEVWVTQSVGQNVSDFPVDRLVGDPDMRKYLANIAVPGINTINSVHETFCISMLDSIALGQLPVAPDAVTFPELVPEGYPWLFKSKADQVEMLDHILRTWPLEYEKWSDVLMAHARAAFDVQQYARAYIGVLEKQATVWHRVKAKDRTRDGITKFTQALQPGTYALPEVAAKMRKGMGNIGLQAFPNRRCMRELMALGAVPVAASHKNERVLGLRWGERDDGEQELAASSVS